MILTVVLVRLGYKKASKQGNMGTLKECEISDRILVVNRTLPGKSDSARGEGMVYLIFVVSPRFTTPLGEETMNAAHGE